MLSNTTRRLPGLSLAKSGLALLVCALLCSCSSLPRRSAPATAGSPALAAAIQLQRQAGSPDLNESRFVTSHLQAAGLAWNEMKSHPANSDTANPVLAASTAALAGYLVPKNPAGGTRTFSYRGVTRSIAIGPNQRRGDFPARAFAALKPATKVPRTLLRTWRERPGVGAPLSPKWNPPADPALAKFTSPKGFLLPVTGLLTFPAGAERTARLELLDPTTVQAVEINGGRMPLAADFSAPVVDRTRNIRELLLALEGLIFPDVRDASLAFLEPYNPDKIPVVLVHGLVSHPRMWRDVVNELIADPVIGPKCQFWVYYYPTGWPIGYSAMRLREDLAAAAKAVGHHKNFVLVGHSMGGILSRMQAVSPGDSLVRAVIPPENHGRFRSLPPGHLARRSLEFQANPQVGRIVFISTPHRGSTMADWSLTTWLTRFVRLPERITSATIDLLPNFAGAPHQFTSISRLSPSNPLFKTLEGLPIKAPHHSIIGDRGRGDTPDSSDGVVAYWSSHLASAESELIVPDDHGAFDDPAAIAELKRILKLEIADDRPGRHHRPDSVTRR